MNKQISDYYYSKLCSACKESDVLDALFVGIREDNPLLVKRSLGLMPKIIDGYPDPMKFAITEMASNNIITMLTDYGFLPFDGFPFPSPFSLKPEEFLRLAENHGNSDINELIGYISYYLHNLKDSDSYCKIPFRIDKDDEYKPYLLSYLDDWCCSLIELAEFDKADKESISSICCSIIENPEMTNAFCKVKLLLNVLDEKQLSRLITLAIAKDNEYAFDFLIESYPGIKRDIQIHYYPQNSSEILHELFDMKQLLPGTDEGFAAFCSYIRIGSANRNILLEILHPSYLSRKDEFGRTPLMMAVRNPDFPVEDYSLLIESRKDLDIHDNEGRTALFYLAGTGWCEYMKELMDLGASPYIRDYKGNNVIHEVIKRFHGDFGTIRDILEFIPAELMEDKNKEGFSPFDLMKQKILGEI